MIIRIDLETFRDWAASGGITLLKEIPRKHVTKKSWNVARISSELQTAKNSPDGRIGRKEAALALNVCTKTITRWQQRGVLPRMLTRRFVEQLSTRLVNEGIS